MSDVHSAVAPVCFCAVSRSYVCLLEAGFGGIRHHARLHGKAYGQTWTCNEQREQCVLQSAHTCMVDAQLSFVVIKAFDVFLTPDCKLSGTLQRLTIIMYPHAVSTGQIAMPINEKLHMLGQPYPRALFIV